MGLGFFWTQAHAWDCLTLAKLFLAPRVDQQKAQKRKKEKH
jgi:hypothetical protein